jgi:hypothetical protein
MKEMQMSMIRNPVFLLAWGLPVVAVVASLLTLFITIRNPDGQLPEQYHWEGFQLDRDFSRAAKAAELGVRARITGFSAAGHCEVQLRAKGTAPETLVLWVSHATLPALDQQVTLQRSGEGASTYVGACRETPEGHWRLELVDAVNGWAVRQSVRGTLSDVTLDAVAGQNE